LSQPITGSLLNVPFWIDPGKVQVAPRSVLYATPASRKFDATLSNWRQPITKRAGLLGSNAIDGSFAASPAMLLPAPLTLTWTLRKGPRTTTAWAAAWDGRPGSGSGESAGCSS
jgi:hypothetical protein